MSTPSDPRTLVMHGLRLKGFAEAPAVAEAVGVAEADAKPVLDELVAQHLATYRDGRISGFTLTPDGRAEHATLLSAELDAVGVRTAVHAAYTRFLGFNTDLLSVCTAWQLRDVAGQPTPNDHSDVGYDTGVIEELATLHTKVEPVCDDLGALLDRFGGYRPRLSYALAQVRAGDLDLFTKPMLPSYHTVWFELHEDLLATLGIARGSEGEA